MLKILIAVVFAVLVHTAHAQSDTLPVKIKFLGSYWHNGKVGGQLWHNILVPENIKKDELIAVAKALFKDRPGYYWFYNDDKEFNALIMSDLHYPSDDYPFPEKWFNRHCIASINQETHLGEWSLRAEGITGQKFAASTQDSFIANLGKPQKDIQ